MDTEIKIGDEVYLSSLNEKYARVVLSTYITNDSIGWLARTMLPSGSIDVVSIRCLKRTGRNFSQIAEVQKQLKEAWYGNN